MVRLLFKFFAIVLMMGWWSPSFADSSENEKVGMDPVANSGDAYMLEPILPGGLPGVTAKEIAKSFNALVWSKESHQKLYKYLLEQKMGYATVGFGKTADVRMEELPPGTYWYGGLLERQRYRVRPEAGERELKKPTVVLVITSQAGDEIAISPKTGNLFLLMSYEQKQQEGKVFVTGRE